MANSRSEKITKLLGEEVMSNEDLLLEVLLRLPAKSLIKFKCVSKHWLSLISDPKFGSQHTRLNPSPLILGVYFHLGLLSVSLDQAHQKNLPSLAYINSASPGVHFGLPKIMHACNGLILCSYGHGWPYLICNVSTQKTTILPDHPLKACSLYQLYPSDYCAYLVTDSSKSPHFKVVLLNMGLMNETTTVIYDYRYVIDVYSSETGVWSSFLFQAQHGSPLDLKAVCDGSLHWITKEKFHVRFEVDTLKFVSNPLPSKPTTMDMKKIRYFGECSGHLFLIHIPWPSAKPFHVFELDKDHSTWKMKYSVNFSLLMAAYPDSFENIGRCCKFVILRLVKEDDINGFSVMLVIRRKIVSYNLRKKTFKVLQEFPMGDFPWGSYRQYCFTDTLPFMPTLFPV